MGGRLRWHEADIKEENWLDDLGVDQVDAVLTSTALHWLPVERLIYLYHQLGQLVRPGGVVLNGDHMPYSTNIPVFESKSFRRLRKFGGRRHSKNRVQRVGKSGGRLSGTCPV